MSTAAIDTVQRQAKAAAQAQARAQRVKLVKTIGIYLLIALTLAIMLCPFYWMVLTSLHSQVDNVSRIPVWFFTPTWENYQNVIARLTPYITYLVPWYLALRALGLIDTYLALTLTHLIVGMPLIVWIMISFFENVPQDLEEAAFVEGATRVGAFMRVIPPLSTPGIVAATILAFIFSWNQFLFSPVLSGPNTRPVPVAVFNFISYGQIDFGGLGAAAVLITLPVIILTLIIQRWIVTGLTMGAVKG